MNDCLCNSLTAKALYDFDMEDKEENLQFFKGDIIQVPKIRCLQQT